MSETSTSLTNNSYPSYESTCCSAVPNTLNMWADDLQQNTKFFLTSPLFPGLQPGLGFQPRPTVRCLFPRIKDAVLSCDCGKYPLTILWHENWISAQFTTTEMVFFSLRVETVETWRGGNGRCQIHSPCCLAWCHPMQASGGHFVRVQVSRLKVRSEEQFEGAAAMWRRVSRRWQAVKQRQVAALGGNATRNTRSSRSWKVKRLRILSIHVPAWL